MTLDTTRRLLCAAAATAWLPAAAQADYPSRPISYVVPFGPGAHSDAVARAVTAEVGRRIGQTIVVDNKAGAGGGIAAQHVAKAAPDGYTLLQTTQGVHVTNVAVYRKLGYDPQKDFTPVVLLVEAPLILIVRRDSPLRSVQDLLAWGRANPGKLNFASPGAGSAHHLAGELFRVTTSLDAMHVPFRGSAPSIQALLAGDIHFIFEASALPLIQSGQVRPLAVTSAQRWYSVPEVQTMVELGFPEVVVQGWYGVVAPAATPRPVLERLNREFNAALTQPSVQSHIRDHLGMQPVGGSMAAFAARVNTEMANWIGMARTARITLD
jgi:tripartite-type tricarboxylate transporter receptor subunit TctC